MTDLTPGDFVIYEYSQGKKYVYLVLAPNLRGGHRWVCLLSDGSQPEIIKNARLVTSEEDPSVAVPVKVIRRPK